MLTIALIIIIIAICASIYDSGTAAEKEKERLGIKNKIKYCYKFPKDIYYQEKTYFKWFDTISEEIKNFKVEGGEQENLGTIIGELYRKYDVPFWDASRKPHKSLWLPGVESLSHTPEYSWEHERYAMFAPVEAPFIRDIKFQCSLGENGRPILNAKKLYEMVYTSYGNRVCYDTGKSAAELIFSSLKDVPSCGDPILSDWRMCLVNPCLNRDIYDVNCTKKWEIEQPIIDYLLFKEQINDMYKKYINAGLIRTRAECNEEIYQYGIDGEQRWKLLYGDSDHPKDTDLVIFSIGCAGDEDDYARAAKKIADSIVAREYTRMEAVIAYRHSRSFFLNLLCLLTKKELASQGYVYRWDWWRDSNSRNDSYTPSEEDYKKYPWFFQ